jgi:hypothetical protein
MLSGFSTWSTLVATMPTAPCCYWVKREGVNAQFTVQVAPVSLAQLLVVAKESASCMFGLVAAVVHVLMRQQACNAVVHPGVAPPIRVVIARV